MDIEHLRSPWRGEAFKCVSLGSDVCVEGQAAAINDVCPGVSGLSNSALSTIVAMQTNRMMSAYKVAATRPENIDRPMNPLLQAQRNRVRFIRFNAKSCARVSAAEIPATNPERVAESRKLSLKLFDCGLSRQNGTLICPG